MILLRALKKAIFSKFDKSDDFDPSLQLFRHTPASIDTTVSDNYPFCYYMFNTEDDRLELGNEISLADNILTFHLFSLADQPSTEVEGLVGDLTSKVDSNPTLDIEQYSLDKNWKNPDLGIMNQNITTDSGTDNWHGIVRYNLITGQ